MRVARAGASRVLPAQPDAAASLRERLASLDPVVLEIHDDSADHAGHAGAAGGAGHFSVLIVSHAFAGLSRLKRHAEVYRRVADLLPHPVHALAIKALAPEEFPS
jgi:BolA protein